MCAKKDLCESIVNMRFYRSQISAALAGEYMKLRIQFIVLVCASLCSAVDFSEYQSSTIKKISTDYEQQSRAERQPGIPDSLFIPMDPAGIPFAISAKYLGETRRLSEFNKTGLEMFSKARRNKTITELFKTEVLIRDKDSVEYWIPIQETHLKSFKAECKGNCNVTLYLVWILNLKQKPFVLINEFKVDN